MRTRLLVVLAGLGAAACVSEPPGATAPRPPSLAVKTNAPSSFVVDVSRDTTAQNETPVAVNPRNSMTVAKHPGSPYYGSVYVTWVQFNGLKGTHSPVQVAVSRDGARSFSTPSKVTQGPIRNNQDARIAIGPDGTLYLTFDNGIQGGKGTANYVAVSRDGGASWSTPVVFALYNNPVCLFPPACFNISGNSFRAPGSYPAPAYDATRNRLDVVYADIAADGLARVYFTSAPAAGVSDPAQWSAPRVVAPGTGDRFGAELGVAPGGRVDVMFDDRGYSGNGVTDETYDWIT